MSSCRGVTKLHLSCPSLSTLLLDEIISLEQLMLSPAAISSLHLGLCTSLTSLNVNAPNLDTLDLTGCGKYGPQDAVLKTVLGSGNQYLSAVLKWTPWTSPTVASTDHKIQ
jgi:hypothetical protein